jgi:hypothetical protein
MFVAVRGAWAVWRGEGRARVRPGGRAYEGALRELVVCVVYGGGG